MSKHDEWIEVSVSLLKTAMAIQCRGKWVAGERKYRDALDHFRSFSSSSIAGQEWRNASVTPNCERPLLSPFWGRKFKPPPAFPGAESINAPTQKFGPYPVSFCWEGWCCHHRHLSRRNSEEKMSLNWYFKTEFCVKIHINTWGVFCYLYYFFHI